MSDYQLAILGSGPAGYAAALRGATHGLKIVLIEEEKVGGVCLNHGCVPAKAWIAAAESVDHARFLNTFAVTPFDYVVDFKKLRENQIRIVGQFQRGLQAALTKKGIDIITGRGRLTTPQSLTVTSPDNERAISFDNLLIATGSRAAKLFDLPADLLIDNRSLFDLDDLPSSLLIVGAGYIGCEFAGALARLGVAVTLVEAEARILPMEDGDISATLAREFKKKKIAIKTGVTIHSMAPGGHGVEAQLSDGSTLTAEKTLVSVGRRFNTDGIGLDMAEVKCGDRGEIVTDDNGRTTIPHVFAAGDVAGKNLLAYTAYHEGMRVADIVAGKRVRPASSIVPTVVFTLPEIGSVGLRQEEAPADANIGLFHFRSLARAHTTGEIVGLVKIIADAATDEILGVHLIGSRATDMIPIASVALANKMTAAAFGDLVFAHPTLAEGLWEACHDVHGEALHK